MFTQLALKPIAFLTLFLLCTANVFAQMPNPYGPPINLENAKRFAVPALTEAAKNGWTMAIAVVDPGGNLVYFEKMDSTQLGSVEVAIEKARSAALFKRIPRYAGGRRGRPSRAAPCWSGPGGRWCSDCHGR